MSNIVDFKYSNGDLLKDKVTGLKGVVMVCAKYSTGCVHYGLLPRKLRNGEQIGWIWLDQSQLKLVKKGVVEFEVDNTQLSGPMPSGPQM